MQDAVTAAQDIRPAPVIRVRRDSGERRRPPIRRGKVLIERVERCLRTCDIIALTRAEHLRAHGRGLDRLGRPADEVIILCVSRGRARRLRECDRIADITGDIRLRHAVRHGEVHGRRRLGSKVDRHLAVLPQCGNAEGIAVLHGVAGGIIAGVGIGRDGHAPLRHGAVLRRVGVRRQCVAVEQRPAGVDILQRIDIAVAGIGIIRGDDDRECGAAALRLLQRRHLIVGGHAVGLADLRRAVPCAAGRLHVRDRLGDGAAAEQAVKEHSLKRIVADKCDRLAVTINGAEAAVHERLFQAVGRHAEADRHPEQAVVGLRVGVHVVGNDRAVHEEIFHAAARAAVNGVPAVIIRLGQAVARLQAEVRRRGAGGVVLAVFVICRAVRVEEDNAAVRDRVRNGVDRRRITFIVVIGTLGRLRHALGLLLVLLGEAAVNAVVRLEQVHIAPVLRAARGVGARLHIGRIVSRGLRRRRDLLQTRRIGTGDALLRHPVDPFAARLDRAGHDRVLRVEIVADGLCAPVCGCIPPRRRLLHVLERVEQRVRSGIIRRRERRVRAVVGRKRRHRQRQQNGDRKEHRQHSFE